MDSLAEDLLMSESSTSPSLLETRKLGESHEATGSPFKSAALKIFAFAS